MKWILENKLITVIITTLISGAGYFITLLNDNAYEKGYFKAKNELITQNNADLERLILLEYKCKYNLCAGHDNGDN